MTGEAPKDADVRAAVKVAREWIEAYGDHWDGEADIMARALLAEHARADALHEQNGELRKALLALWKLWRDPRSLQQAADYSRGHLSYASTLDQKEREIWPVIKAATDEMKR